MMGYCINASDAKKVYVTGLVDMRVDLHKMFTKLDISRVGPINSCVHNMYLWWILNKVFEIWSSYFYFFKKS